MTLEQLGVTVALLTLLGLAAGRFGLSAIPAYLSAGILLGPNEPRLLSVIEPSQVTEFVAQLGLIFLLFFLGLEFSLDRLLRSGQHVGRGGGLDLVINGILGGIVGLAAFGPSLAAMILAAGIYVSSSAITVKGLIDFRRLADHETDLVLAILVFEDIVMALVLGFAGGGGSINETVLLIVVALGLIGAVITMSRYLRPAIDRLFDWLPREFFLLTVFGLLIGMAAISDGLGLSEAIGALMAGVLFAETSVREEIEERFFSFRDIFAALFFFVFGLTIDVTALGGVAWLLVAAVVVSVVGKLASGFAAGAIAGLTRRQQLNAGAALVAHGEFTIILAQVASSNTSIAALDRAQLNEFAGLYVLATATIGTILMKESPKLGVRLFPTTIRG
ncbi:MAG: monovalent cation:H+ antiporter-2, family [Gaiellales bacterium]|jgi:CPA2 family monovalent cation:H+ antiporter-2|nr:monovalent cation:H+ antiporter-2, family [Gaiellales bacterium]